LSPVSHRRIEPLEHIEHLLDGADYDMTPSAGRCTGPKPGNACRDSALTIADGSCDSCLSK
jgi:hypothetical protein